MSCYGLREGGHAKVWCDRRGLKGQGEMEADDSLWDQSEEEEVIFFFYSVMFGSSLCLEGK